MHVPKELQWCTEEKLESKKNKKEQRKAIRTGFMLGQRGG